VTHVPDQGEHLSSPPKAMTRERMRWYCDALETAADADGTFKIADPTIHSSDDYAHDQGLPAIIADGMISTNWISGMLVRRFGMAYLSSGELMTKFIRPIYEDEVIETHGEVVSVELADGHATVRLDVWCQTDSGLKCTVGNAQIAIPTQVGSDLSVASETR
jgi:3-hydroxybutyryl-CoA dehydratase